MATARKPKVEDEAPAEPEPYRPFPHVTVEEPPYKVSPIVTRPGWREDNPFPKGEGEVIREDTHEVDPE